MGSLPKAFARVGDECRVNVSISARKVSVPVDSVLQPLLPGHLLLPAQLVKLIGINIITKIIKTSVLHKSHHIIRIGISHGRDEAARHVDILLFIGAADVVDVSRLALEEDDLECARHVLHVQEVARVLPSAVKSYFVSTQQLIDELGDEFLGVLVGSVHVVAASDDDGHVEGAVVRLGEKFGTSFRGRVWVRGLKNLLLTHGVLVQRLLAVHLVCAHVDKAADAHDLGGLQHHMRAHYVILRKLERISKGVVNMSLSSEVQNRVDLLRLQHVLHQLGAANVSTNKLVVGQVLNFVTVFNARTIIKAVKVDNVELRIFSCQKNNQMGSYEARAACDHDILWVESPILRREIRLVDVELFEFFRLK